MIAHQYRMRIYHHKAVDDITHPRSHVQVMYSSLLGSIQHCLLPISLLSQDLPLFRILALVQCRLPFISKMMMCTSYGRLFSKR